MCTFASIRACSRHPTSPAVFASTNGNGTLELWNLANDWAVRQFVSVLSRVWASHTVLHARAYKIESWV